VLQPLIIVSNVPYLRALRLMSERVHKCIVVLMQVEQGESLRMELNSELFDRLCIAVQTRTAMPAWLLQRPTQTEVQYKFQTTCSCTVIEFPGPSYKIYL